MFLCLFLAALFLPEGAVGSIDATNLQTFGGAVKGTGLHPGNATEVYSRTGRQGCLTIMWFTGSLIWPTFGETLIKVYVDDESEASLQFQLDPALGVSYPHGQLKPWGTVNEGKLAVGGGWYSTMRVPFGSSVRITAQLAPEETQSRSLYFMTKGLTNYPVVLTGSHVSLPMSARLRLFKTDVTLDALDYVYLAQVNATGGALYMVSQMLHSENAHCLEGEHDVVLGGNGSVGEHMLLSSGFEDYYLSGQYFDSGTFHSPLSGLTYEDHLLEPNKLSAYRHPTYRGCVTFG